MGCIKLAYYENNNTLKVAFRAKDSTYLRDLNYYPFGQEMPGRNFSSNTYRFGFNGQEKDDEIFGSVGSAYAFEYRMEDSRVGRFWSPDPLFRKYPELTPYQFASNNPIWMIEIEGLEGEKQQNVEPRFRAYLKGELFAGFSASIGLTAILPIKLEYTLSGMVNRGSVYIEWKPSTGWNIGAEGERKNIDSKSSLDLFVYGKEKSTEYGINEHPGFAKTLTTQRILMVSQELDNKGNEKDNSDVIDVGAGVTVLGQSVKAGLSADYAPVNTGSNLIKRSSLSQAFQKKTSIPFRAAANKKYDTSTDVSFGQFATKH